MRKKLMILGAGYTQLPLIDTAKAMGIHTIVASIPGNYPGFAAADEFVYVDIADPEAVTEKAAAIGADGVCTCGLDLGMAAIGAACEALGLPGPSREAARKASNKWDMKRALAGAGVQTARFACVRSREELGEALKELPFPVILKAVDQMGSRGIYRCDTEAEVWENYEKTMAATAKDYCLIEEFIEGEIFGVEAMVQNGELVYLLPNNIEAFAGAVPTPVGHSVPFRELDALGEQIRTQTERAIRALGLDNCPVNCDFTRRDGRVYVIELTGRSGATGLSEMTGLYFGINYYEMIVRVALGMPVRSFFGRDGLRGDGTPNLARTLISDRRGIVRAIHNYNGQDEAVCELSFNIAPGDEVRPYTNGRDRIGQIVVRGASLEECEERMRRAVSNIRLELEGDIPLYATPIHPIGDRAGNRVWVKREDLLPFSFGGNKVRFAQYYLEDMERRGADGMIIYGNYRSNLCRILSAACQRKGIPCSMVHNVDDVGDAHTETPGVNERLIRAAGVKEFPCHKGAIAEAVTAAMEDMRERGLVPYYIYGDALGRGNEWVPMQAYVHVYREICEQERELGVRFDYIFLACSTGATQAGLTAGELLEGDGPRVIGISVSRTGERARGVIAGALREYEAVRRAGLPADAEKAVRVTDSSLAGGYGKSTEEIGRVIREAYVRDGLNLDSIYTGKAFCGMEQYLRGQGIRGKHILFLHTGGTPLFFEEQAELEIL